MTSLLHLADALCAADSGNWREAADLSERAINVMPGRYATSARALALQLAAQAEAALNDVGAVHALRYADYCSDRHWESRTQMVNAARANMHTEQLRIERDTHARNAMVDELTGLANRRGYNRHVERLNRRQAERPLAVVLVDIDDFKSVNDTHGHAAGDQVLARVAYALSQGTRPTDLVARLGGDEFVALIDNGDPEVAHQRATDLLARLSVEPWNLVARDLSIAVSIGVAVSKPGTEHGGDYERLVRRADAALYVAKARGGNRVEVAHGDRMIDRATTTDL